MSGTINDETDDSRHGAADGARRKPSGGGRGSAPGGRGHQVQSVARAATLLMLVARRRTDGTGKQLAEAANLPVPTAHHLLATLVAEGLLAKDDHVRYVLGPRAALLSEAVQRDLTPPGYLLGPLRELVRRTGETSYIAAWRGGEIRILASLEGHRPVRVSVPTGHYGSAHARASGKLFLAHVDDEVRAAYLDAHPLTALTERTITDRDELLRALDGVTERGYATDEEEFMEGVCCVSVPIHDESIVLAAYSMSVPAARWQADGDTLTQIALETAEEAVRGEISPRS